MEDFLNAKKIFMKYSASSFQMSRDNVYDEYKSYKVPNDLEKKWVVELENSYKEKLLLAKDNNDIKNNFLGLLNLIFSIGSFEMFKSCFSMFKKLIDKGKLDSYTKVILCSAFLNTMRSNFFSSTYPKEAVDIKKFFINVLKTAYQENIYIDKSYLNEKGEYIHLDELGVKEVIKNTLSEEFEDPFY